MNQRYPRPRGAKNIFYRRYYLLPSGKVIRAAPAKGARPGYSLNPWLDRQGFEKVHLYCGDRIWRVRLKDLLRRYFRK